jgi:MinD-like ATPase involved in chromosome partitioning or flagellar assembly
VGVIAFASAKSSPGVTTTIAALAASWPAHRHLHIVELDPAGGDLVVRFELAPEPGLVTLAATGRRDLRLDTYLAHTQPLPASSGADGPERRILVAPVAAEQASAALAALRFGLPGVLGTADADVLVDCGRLDPSSPAHEFAVDADLLVVVTRPIVSEIHHLAARLASLKPRAVSLLVVGDKPYGVTDVAEVIGATPLGTLPTDDRAAEALTLGHPHALRVLRRSRLLRDARAVAEGLADWLGPQRSEGVPGAAGPAEPFPHQVEPAPFDPAAEQAQYEPAVEAAPYEPAAPPLPAPPPPPPPPAYEPSYYEAPPAPAPEPGPGYGPQTQAQPGYEASRYEPPPVYQPPPVPQPQRPDHNALPAYGAGREASSPPTPPAAGGNGHAEDAQHRPVQWPSKPWTNGGAESNGGRSNGRQARHFRRDDEDQA